ncbi:dethiobiotin synthase [Sphingobacterium sp. 1.A.5]|uniref:dethiobiotin synthase n=1 Tax=Sphingobacterium sp. 1.A.5 TaxID=2044604 RepID=UPI000C0BE6E5|nr:dethiobiotin synthase [Sphingobacterium sp. 1.A.5]
MSRRYFVTGIGTSVGKTIACAALVKLWDAAYWKPIQSGDLESSDSLMMSSLLNNQVLIYPERYKLNTAASPHYSAEIDEVSIELNDFKLPDDIGNLIVEGAGGMFVPINDKEFIIDLAEHLDLPIILVCSDYLGSINHSLLSFHSLEERGVAVEYIFLNGSFKESTKRILIKNKPKGSKVIEFPELEDISSNGLEKAMKNLKIHDGN